MTDLDLVEARWRTGRILTSDLATLAAELVAAGHEAPALTALAGGRVEPRSAFERALLELGGGRMGHAEAVLLLARSFAEQLLAGESPPDLTAKALGGLRWKGGPEVDDVLVPFVGLARRYEAARAFGPLRRAVEPFLDRRVRAEARALLRRPG